MYAKGLQPVVAPVKSCLPSAMEKPYELLVPATVSVLPLMDRVLSEKANRPLGFGTAFFQPALPVFRSTCWSAVHLAPSLALSAYAKTIRPVAEGLAGAAHSGNGTSMCHFGEPSLRL